MLLLKLLYLILSLLLFMKKAPHALPPARARGVHKKKSQGNCEHGPQFTLFTQFILLFFYPIYFIFHPLKACYIVKKVSAEQNAGHVQLCHYFIWQVMACLINVVIDNGCLSMCCSLEAVQCKPCCPHFRGCSTLVAPSFLHEKSDNSTCSFGN